MLKPQRFRSHNNESSVIEEASDSNYERDSPHHHLKVSSKQQHRASNSQNNSVSKESELVFVSLQEPVCRGDVLLKNSNSLGLKRISGALREKQESQEMSVEFGSEDELSDYAANAKQMAFIQSDFTVQHKEFKR